ncbi:MAG: hypothetical protein IAI48_00430 [Candidatus Eremiobacteraeota bacterium]|nr:hypothetical protein [Candidatus Eremiobacteraeota bacterium]
MNVRVIGKSQQFNEDSVSVAAIDLGNGLAALLMVSATYTKTTANPQTISAVILQADTTAGSRKAAIIANNTSTNLHLVTQVDPNNGTPAAEVVLAPGLSWDTPDNYQGSVEAWSEGTPTGLINITVID